MIKDSFLEALGQWQNGWNENIERKKPIEESLAREVSQIDQKYKKVGKPCFRKRFLYKTDMANLVLNFGIDDGISSWTTNLRRAEEFKGIYRSDAVTAAVFQYTPPDKDVVLNIEALWECSEFRNIAEKYILDEKSFYKALDNFRGKQCEVILKSHLLSDLVIGMTGPNSDFDKLCDILEIDDESERNRRYKELMNQGIYPGEWDYIAYDSCQRVLNKIRYEFENKIKDLESKSHIEK